MGAMRLPFRAPRLPAGRVAVVRLYGPIAGAGRTADLVETLRRVRESRRVPAVVVDVDSGGGSAAASDDLFLAVERLANVKPVVAAIRGTGASGAYLAVLASHRIVANPTSIVGSIGVISAGPRVSGLLDRVGVRVSEQKAGRLKGLGAPWREETPEEVEKEQELVDAIYERFVARVAHARRLPETRVRELATGELWLGDTAVELGLVDEVGDLERAVEIAADMAHAAPRWAAVRAPRPFMRRLVDRFAFSVAAALADEIELRAGDRFRLG
jgi:protease-4